MTNQPDTSSPSTSSDEKVERCGYVDGSWCCRERREAIYHACAERICVDSIEGHEPNAGCHPFVSESTQQSADQTEPESADFPNCPNVRNGAPCGGCRHCVAFYEAKRPVVESPAQQKDETWHDHGYFADGCKVPLASLLAQPALTACPSPLIEQPKDEQAEESKNGL